VAIVQVQELIESGVHFGHRASRWNPKMRPFIYGKRNLIHIIDLKETVRGLLRAYRFLAKVASRGSLVLFVGTKRQAKEAIEREAGRSGMPYVSERWLGGTLTNYRTIRDRLKTRQPRHEGVHEGHAQRIRQAGARQSAGNSRHSRL
jgi:small subunit ribosomal protein S2